MNADPLNVSAFHCKAGKGRTGTIISAYLVHVGFPNYSTSVEALKLYGMIRTKNGKGVTIPSQMRYVRYYEYCLKDGFPMEDKKLVLKSLMLTNVPKIGEFQFFNF
jgi:phosphatidylinositol-3,4,5-trisphosphate 3-phosphatase and dual-specificity protein phosphatase PTEN